MLDVEFLIACRPCNRATSYEYVKLDKRLNESYVDLINTGWRMKGLNREVVIRMCWNRRFSWILHFLEERLSFKSRFFVGDFVRDGKCWSINNSVIKWKYCYCNIMWLLCFMLHFIIYCIISLSNKFSLVCARYNFMDIFKKSILGNRFSF